MSSSTQLLVNPIMGIQPKYTIVDFKKYIAWPLRKSDSDLCGKYETLIISLANFLCKIDINDRDRKLLWKALWRNEKMLKSMDISKEEFNAQLFDAVYEALDYKYKSA